MKRKAINSDHKIRLVSLPAMRACDLHPWGDAHLWAGGGWVCPRCCRQFSIRRSMMNCNYCVIARSVRRDEAIPCYKRRLLRCRSQRHMGQRAACPVLFRAVTVREWGGAVTSSALRASSPKGEDSALGVLYAKGLLADMKWLVQRASPLGEVGGVGFVRADIVPDHREWDAVNFG